MPIKIVINTFVNKYSVFDVDNIINIIHVTISFMHITESHSCDINNKKNNIINILNNTMVGDDIVTLFTCSARGTCIEAIVSTITFGKTLAITIVVNLHSSAQKS